MARTEVVLPSLGESVTEALITTWLKQPGDAVAEDEPLLEVSTDKIDSEIPAPVAGVLVEVIAGEGSEVPVGSVVAYIETDADAADRDAAIGGVVEQAAASGGIDDSDGTRMLPAPNEPAAQITAPISIDTVGLVETGDADGGTLSPSDAMAADEAETKFAPAGDGNDSDGDKGSDAGSDNKGSEDDGGSSDGDGDGDGDANAAASDTSDSDGGKADSPNVKGLITSPVVRKLIRQHGLDPSTMTGSGVGGRITRRDVLSVIDANGRPVGADADADGPEQSRIAQSDLELVDPPYPANPSPSSAIETGISGPEGPIPGSGHSSDSLTFDLPGGALAESTSREGDSPQGGTEASAEDDTSGSAKDDQTASNAGDPQQADAASSAPQDAKEQDSASTDSAPRSDSADGSTSSSQPAGGGAVALRMPSVAELLSEEPSAGRTAPRPAPLQFTDGLAHIPLTGMRGAVARNMEQSFRSIPHVSQSVDIDYERIDSVRERIKRSWRAEEGFSLSYLPFIARAVCMSIAEYPLVNAHLDGDSLIVPRYVNLGIAVDLDFEGLIVPVIRDAHTMRVPQLARAISEIARRARARELKPDEISGGTYTLSNNGSFGTRSTAAIIAPGQSAVLSVDGIEPRPAVVDGAIGIRKTGMLVQSFDHRAIDGSYSASFLTRLKSILEQHNWAQEFVANS